MESTSNNSSSQEHEILMRMRKVLTAVIRDTTPQPGMQHPLSTKTIEDIKSCLGLIAAREHELAHQRGVNKELPFFTDERPSAEVVSINKIRYPKKP